MRLTLYASGNLDVNLECQLDMNLQASGDILSSLLVKVERSFGACKTVCCISRTTGSIFRICRLCWRTRCIAGGSLSELVSSESIYPHLAADIAIESANVEVKSESENAGSFLFSFQVVVIEDSRETNKSQVTRLLSL